MTLTTLPEWAALGPVFALVATALLVLLVNTVAPDSDHGGLFATLTTGGGLTGLGTTVWYLLGDTGQPDGGGPIVLFDGNLVVDGMALFFTVVLTSVVVLVGLASYDYLESYPDRAAYYSLTLLSATGMTLLAAANSFVIAFISIELISYAVFCF